MPFEYVKKHVKPMRDQVRRKNHREKWWLFGEARPGMRRALSGLTRYIATPWVSKYRIFNWISIDTIPSLVAVIARDDDYFLGVLQSKIHQLWALKQGSSLEDRPRYTPTTTFETFPFPYPPGAEKQKDPRVQAIASAAKELVEQRDRWLQTSEVSPEDSKSLKPSKKTSEVSTVKRTLTNLYNQRPTWLELSHKKLDDAVFAAYGWENTLSDEEILERLLALNLERAGKQK